MPRDYRMEVQMRDWISDLLIFSAGITGGILISYVKPYLQSARIKRTEMFAAQARILADLKERRDEEILQEAFRTTEAIRGELAKSLQTLRETVTTALDPITEPHSGESGQTIQLTDPIQPNRSTL
jgi:hypothetical protein